MSKLGLLIFWNEFLSWFYFWFTVQSPWTVAILCHTWRITHKKVKVRMTYMYAYNTSLILGWCHCIYFKKKLNLRRLTNSIRWRWIHKYKYSEFKDCWSMLLHSVCYSNLMESGWFTMILCRRSLDRLVADHFPVKSTDLPESSPHFKDYTAAIDRVW